MSGEVNAEHTANPLRSQDGVYRPGEVRVQREKETEGSRW